MCPIAKLTVFYDYYLSAGFPEWNTVKKHSRRKQTGCTTPTDNPLEPSAPPTIRTPGHFCGLVFAQEQGIQLECLLALARFRTT